MEDLSLLVPHPGYATLRWHPTEQPASWCLHILTATEKLSGNQRNWTTLLVLRWHNQFGHICLDAFCLIPPRLPEIRWRFQDSCINFCFSLAVQGGSDTSEGDWKGNNLRNLDMITPSGRSDLSPSPFIQQIFPENMQMASFFVSGYEGLRVSWTKFSHHI